MTITISESKILQYMTKGFINCGDSWIIPEDATKQDVDYLVSCGYEIMEVK